MYSPSSEFVLTTPETIKVHAELLRVTAVSVSLIFLKREPLIRAVISPDAMKDHQSSAQRELLNYTEREVNKVTNLTKRFTMETVLQIELHKIITALNFTDAVVNFRQRSFTNQVKSEINSILSNPSMYTIDELNARRAPGSNVTRKSPVATIEGYRHELEILNPPLTI